MNKPTKRPQAGSKYLASGHCKVNDNQTEEIKKWSRREKKFVEYDIKNKCGDNAYAYFNKSSHLI